jgi:hypothetical protein
MPNVPLCALVHGDAVMAPRVLSASARSCLSDVRLVLQAHGFQRSANALLLASLCLDDDVADVESAEVERLLKTG